ncbi:uncharacterized protein BP01DRAFT_136171 [Aspergillus saccharolyticus JOP 1030-1]|uniref:Uncharacterized protein n=1 Tax=Aspergillus saccharolyticus JOP 1030-1 TaxID=1450539 RepID=A0A319A4B8_9EURO|nr:hypothetical protein BP01DRAFT_136171 [Aspergillus saccharolyticus JOP 1030-1]PYH42282.1 hypothetical protein BP01DRAFT_136171 [Aspergillus saccharolyticus JOP 1030-1]
MSILTRAPIVGLATPEYSTPRKTPRSMGDPASTVARGQMRGFVRPQMALLLFLTRTCPALAVLSVVVGLVGQPRIVHRCTACGDQHPLTDSRAGTYLLATYLTLILALDIPLLKPADGRLRAFQFLFFCRYLPGSQAILRSIRSIRWD